MPMLFCLQPNPLSTPRVPPLITLECLAKISTIVDDYQLRQAFHIVAPLWISTIKSTLTDSSTIGKTLFLWMFRRLGFPGHGDI